MSGKETGVKNRERGIKESSYKAKKYAKFIQRFLIFQWRQKVSLKQLTEDDHESFRNKMTRTPLAAPRQQYRLHIVNFVVSYSLNLVRSSVAQKETNLDMNLPSEKKIVNVNKSW